MLRKAATHRTALGGLLIPIFLSASLDARLQDGPPVGGVARENAFIEWDASRRAYYVSESVEIVLRFGFEADFLDGRLLQLFPQRLDVPVQLDADALQDLHGALPMQTESGLEESAERPGSSCVLNGDIVHATRASDREVQGRCFRIFEIRRSLLPLEPGPARTLTLPAARLRFAHGTLLERDLLGGQEATDRREATLVGRPLTLAILSWPEEQRPPEFSGAVGRFTLEARAEPRDLTLDQSLELTLTITGEGNLFQFEPPSLAQLDDFHVLGVLESKRRGERSIRYDLAARHTRVRAVPPIVFAYFQPTEPVGYRIASTRPIPIRVRPAAASADRPRAGSVSRAKNSDPSGDAEHTPSLLRPAFFSASLVGICLLLFLWRRRAR